MLSSHLLTQVQSVCDRIGIFAAGRLIGVGTVDELAAQFGDGSAMIEVGLELPTAADIERAGATLRALRSVESVEAPTDANGTWRVHVRPADVERTRPPGDPRRRGRAGTAPDGAPPGRAVARRDLSQPRSSVRSRNGQASNAEAPTGARPGGIPDERDDRPANGGHPTGRQAAAPGAGPAWRLARHRGQGARRPPAQRPVHRPADRPRPGGGDPALLRGGPDPARRRPRRAARPRSSWRCSRSARRGTASSRSTRSSRSSRRCSGWPSPSMRSTASVSEGTLPRSARPADLPRRRDQREVRRRAGGHRGRPRRGRRDHRRVRHLPTRHRPVAGGDPSPRPPGSS